MNLTLIISSLASGGAERVMTNLSSHWAKHGHNITLITLDSSSSDFFSLDSVIHRVSIDSLKPSNTVWDGLIANIRRIQKIRKVIKTSNPDAVISFLDATNLISAISCVGLKIPLIVSERTDPTQNSIGVIRSFIRPFLYRYACDFVVVQTEKVKEKCHKMWPGAKLQVIPNPLPDDLPPVSQAVRNKIVLLVGRLDTGKGHDVVIRAFSMISSDFPDWNLRIIGDGVSRDYLESMVSDLGLCDQIQLLGAIKDIYSEYASAEVFCLASRYEGFPNALLEALSMGCACISTDCDSGPNEILENGRLGILVPVDDISALSKQMALMMSRQSFRLSFQVHVKYIRDKFNMDSVANQWISLVASQSK